MDANRDKTFEERQSERLANVRTAEKLIARANNLVNSQKDFQNGLFEIQQLREDWRNYANPLPIELSETLYQSFNSAITLYINHKESIGKKKARDLISKAEDLINSRDWNETTHQLQLLRERWPKEAHPLPRDEKDTLWNEFNGCINRFFESRNNEKLNQAKELVKKAELLQTSQDWVGADREYQWILQRIEHTNPIDDNTKEDLIDQVNSYYDEFLIKKLTFESDVLENELESCETQLDAILAQKSTLAANNFIRRDQFDTLVKDLEAEIKIKEKKLVSTVHRLDDLMAKNS